MKNKSPLDYSRAPSVPVLLAGDTVGAVHCCAQTPQGCYPLSLEIMHSKQMLYHRFVPLLSFNLSYFILFLSYGFTT